MSPLLRVPPPPTSLPLPTSRPPLPRYPSPLPPSRHASCGSRRLMCVMVPLNNGGGRRRGLEDRRDCIWKREMEGEGRVRPLVSAGGGVVSCVATMLRIDVAALALLLLTTSRYPSLRPLRPQHAPFDALHCTHVRALPTHSPRHRTTPVYFSKVRRTKEKHT